MDLDAKTAPDASRSLTSNSGKVQSMADFSNFSILVLTAFSGLLGVPGSSVFQIYRTGWASGEHQRRASDEKSSGAGRGEGGRGGTTYGDSTRGTTLLMPPTLTVRRGGDPGELHLSGFAGDCVTQVSPASGIEGGTGNQNLSAAAGPRWCVPWPLVAPLAPSLVVELRLAESWVFEHGRRIRDGEDERARRGSLPPTGASPGRYIGTFDNGRFVWNIRGTQPCQSWGRDQGRRAVQVGTPDTPGGWCGRPCFERWSLERWGGGTTTQGQKEREGLLVPRQ